jgi:hypothetical protein
MSGLTEMMEYITKYFPGICNSIRACREMALHILLKIATSCKPQASSEYNLSTAFLLAAYGLQLAAFSPPLAEKNGTTVCVFFFSGKAVSLVTCSIRY